MVIAICGFGYSGSGAVIDYLKEIEGITVMDCLEMNLLYIPDGIKDLEYHLCENHYRFMSSDIAIYRFLERMETIAERMEHKQAEKFMTMAMQYIDSLTKVSWEGYSFCHRSEYNRRQRYWKFRFPRQVRFYLKKVHINLPPVKNPTRTMRLSVSPENFLSETQRFVSDVIALLVKTDDIRDQKIVIDQLFAADNVDTCIKYVPNCKVISVVRDPRDIYLLLKVGLKNRVSFIPTDDVTKFVEYYLSLINPAKTKSQTGITIHYEDLVYNYEKTTRQICEYIDVPWSKEKKFFDPAVSVRNTQLYRRFPMYAEDIKYIEEKCGSYLYVFDEDLRVDKSVELF